MRIAGTVQDSIVDGPGLRFVVFTQGCLHGCEGCHNPATHPLDGGKETTVQNVISEMLSNPLTDGVTLSGGEPFLQASDCALIARAAHEANLNVWCYSGYTYEGLLSEAESKPEFSELLNEIDVLIDGPFVLALRSLNIKWRGSKNQRVIDVNKTRETGSVVKLID